MSANCPSRVHYDLRMREPSQKEMFTDPPQPALLDKVKEHREIGRDAAMALALGEIKLPGAFADAEIAGHLTVYCAVVDETSVAVDKGSIEMVPQEAVKLP